MSKVASKEESVIRHALSVAGEDAYHRALSNGVAVTILQDDKIERVYPNGKKVVVRKVERVDRKVVAKRIRLK